MDNNDQPYVIKPLGERVAVLETRLEDIQGELKDITKKLDELLTLKAKGMGAVGLVSLLFVSASGVIGLIAFLASFFRPHL